jgi:hypothetical protein
MNAHTKPSARETLRAAIAVRDNAAARVREAAATLTRAGRLTADAQRRLAALGDVDGQVLAHATAAYRTFAAAGGERPDVGTPTHLAERQRARDTARQELAAASAAQAELADEHAAAQGEHERREREVAAAADAVIVEQTIKLYAAYVDAIKAARTAWDGMVAITAMTQAGSRLSLPGLEPLITHTIRLGFGHREDELMPPLLRPAVDPIASAWEDLRRRLHQDADAQI